MNDTASVTEAEKLIAIARELKEDPELAGHLTTMGAVALMHTQMAESGIKAQKLNSKMSRLSMFVVHTLAIFISGTGIVGCVWLCTWLLQGIVSFLKGN